MNETPPTNKNPPTSSCLGQDEWVAIVKAMSAQLSLIISLRGDLIASKAALIDLIKGDKVAASDEVRSMLKLDTEQGIAREAVDEFKRMISIRK